VRVVFAILVLSITTLASAQATPVIEAGREQEILGLFQPHVLGKEVTPGWKLWDVNVSPLAIRVECRGPEQKRAVIRLAHPSAGQGERTQSFVVERDPSSDPAGIPALQALSRAVANNDRGNFFRSIGVPRVEVSSNRARFLAVPVATFVLALGAMLLARRLKGQRA
jgi:hypothetical protein